MQPRIDDTDMELLDILQSNAKARIHSIARKMGIPPSTVHHRMQRLEREGAIAGWTIRKGYHVLGLKMKAYVLVFVDLAVLSAAKRTQKDVAMDIKKVAGVESADIVTGDADILVTVRCRDMDDYQKILLERLQSIKGITKTKTMMVVSES